MKAGGIKTSLPIIWIREGKGSEALCYSPVVRAWGSSGGWSGGSSMEDEVEAWRWKAAVLRLVELVALWVCGFCIRGLSEAGSVG